MNEHPQQQGYEQYMSDLAQASKTTAEENLYLAKAKATIREQFPVVQQGFWAPWLRTLAFSGLTMVIGIFIGFQLQSSSGGEIQLAYNDTLTEIDHILADLKSDSIALSDIESLTQ